MNHLLPLALSHFLPSVLTRGAVWEPLWPGQRPKCLLASLSLGPLNKRTPFPVGANWANWSKVKAVPFAAVILFLAYAVNLRAQTLSPSGILRSLVSLVTVPTTATILWLNWVFPAGTAVLSLLRCLTMRETERGYLLSLDWLSLLWTTWLNLASVLLCKKEYN